MIKVRILDRCEFCDGEAYIFDYEDVDARGDAYDRYRAGLLDLKIWPLMAGGMTIGLLLLAAVFGATRLRVYF